MDTDNFIAVPWDTAVFGIPVYEIVSPTLDALRLATQSPGHYTARIDPLATKQSLHHCGFYYCDTLIEPYCDLEQFIPFNDMDVSVCPDLELHSLLGICHGAFSHGRFHRDFNLSLAQANQRYDNWLAHLHATGKVYGLLYRGELAGFIAVDGNKLVLHALGKSQRGRGLAKSFWTPVCRTLFEAGHTQLTSSVSATNLAVMNLYARLGFRFRNPVDIYHRLTR